MNLLINPSGQFARIATSFASLDDGAFGLARWRALMDANGRIGVSQVKNPLAQQILWNSNGFGGIAQTIEREEFEASVGDQKIIAFDAWKVGATDAITVDLVAWSGTANKPSIDPITGWGTSLTPSANWSVVASQAFNLSATRTRLQMPVTVPDVANLAVIIRTSAYAGDKVYVTKVTFDDDATYRGYNFLHEWKRSEWFFQHYTVAELINIEWGVGNTRYTAHANFQFPLRSPLRGRMGGPGKDDMTVQWSGSWWAYAAGGEPRYFVGAPNLQCHHGWFLFFDGALSGAQPADAPLVYRLCSPDTVTIDAELRPTP